MTASAVSYTQNSTVRDYITLMKPGVMSLVVFTGFAGMAVAPGQMHPLMAVLAIACIALGSGAGAAINMWYDRDIDALMARTAKRPLPQGRIAPDDALAFGITLGLFAVMVMQLAAGWLAAFVLAFAIAFYAVIYTMWLKRSTPQNIVIGGAAGAFPPVIGWAAMTGSLSVDALVLFLIIFLWTPPHFWALALYRNSDYARAGVPMMPVVAGASSTKKQMLAYTLILLPVTLMPLATGLSGWVYGVGASLLGLNFIRHALRVMQDSTDASAKRMFGFSILYLFALFSFMIADKWLAALV